MNGKRITASLIGLLCCLAVVSAVVADSNHNVDRFAIGSGGDPGQSESYDLESIIIGQAIAGASISENYNSCTGLLCSVGYRVYLPLVLR